ncbi:hypothetical protein PO250_01195 [Limosilactobacillus mucosae]|uniref:Uncharacterized protein n=1 Tax=Limosilactobacillus mucosae TaxID=97478 RepID=A0AAJ1HTC4_LIMMU|nr:hypothetical protein [Limosilactobacillus mucosae]MDC2828951.1 hypothetical protein [Limosilactobacillus mucosae]
MNNKEIMAKASQYFDTKADSMFYNEWQQKFFKLTDYPRTFDKAKHVYLSAIEQKLSQMQNVSETEDLFNADSALTKEQIFDIVTELAMATPDDVVEADFKQIASIVNSRLSKADSQITVKQVRQSKPVWQKYVAESSDDSESLMNECAELFLQTSNLAV